MKSVVNLIHLIILIHEQRQRDVSKILTLDFSYGDDADEGRMFRIDGFQFHSDAERILFSRKRTFEELGRGSFSSATIKIHDFL